jgi:hypothetical protein
MRIFPQDGKTHYYLRVHHRFTGQWETKGPYTRDDNSSLGDNVDMIQVMSGETIPITVVFVIQKPT